MARNQEKAQAMLNRWVQGKRDERTGEKARRPHLASSVDSLSECEKWRGQIIRQIAKHVSIIQNAGLGEHKVRDVNDRINKLMREKRAWEHQIKALGGNDYTRDGARITDADGKRAFGANGYYYFGAARELPGVRELFEQKNAAEAPKQTRLELHKSVNADYYGYRDDDDGLLLPLEAAAEAAARAKAADKHAKQQHALALARVKALGLGVGSDGKPLSDEALNKLAADLTASNAAAAAAAVAAAASSASASAAAMADDATGSSAGAAGAATDELKAHVVLPTEQDLERAVLEKKRKDLLSRYGDASAAGALSAAAAAAAPTAMADG